LSRPANCFFSDQPGHILSKLSVKKEFTSRPQNPRPQWYIRHQTICPDQLIGNVGYKRENRPQLPFLWNQFYIYIWGNDLFFSLEVPLSGHNSMIDFGVTEKKAEQLRQRMAHCGLCEADLDERHIRGSGPGGQKINKTASCVQLRHTPSGNSVKMQKSRSLALNRFYARRRLCELIEATTLGSQSPEKIKEEKIRKQKSRRRRRGKSR
jgi:hypothetical protein